MEMIVAEVIGFIVFLVLCGLVLLAMFSWIPKITIGIVVSIVILMIWEYLVTRKK